MYVLSQTNPKLFHAGGLKPRDVPSGTAILVSAVRRRYGQIIVLILFVRTNAKETPKGRICVVPTHRKPKPNKSGHSLVPSWHIFSPTVSPCLAKGKHSSFPYPLTPTKLTFATCIVLTFIFKNHSLKVHLPHHTSACRHVMLTFKQNYARKYFGVSYCNAFSASVLCKTVIFASLSKKSCKNLLTNQIACAKIISLKQQCSYF